MASLKVCSFTVHNLPPYAILHQAPDNLFVQPQFMTHMERAYASSNDALAALPMLQAQARSDAAALPPLPRPQAAVAHPSAVFVTSLTPRTASVAAAPYRGLPSPQQPAAAVHALAERCVNQPASAPAAAAAAEEEEEDLGSAWGISDPRTLAALKKREAKFKGKDAARRQKEVRLCFLALFETLRVYFHPGHGNCRRAPRVFQGSLWRRVSSVIMQVWLSASTTGCYRYGQG